jgi:hypothetical protein
VCWTAAGPLAAPLRAQGVHLRPRDRFAAMVYPGASRDGTAISLILANGAGIDQTSGFIVRFVEGFATRGVGISAPALFGLLAPVAASANLVTAPMFCSMTRARTWFSPTAPRMMSGQCHLSTGLRIRAATWRLREIMTSKTLRQPAGTVSIAAILPVNPTSSAVIAV